MLMYVYLSIRTWQVYRKPLFDLTTLEEYIYVAPVAQEQDRLREKTLDPYLTFWLNLSLLERQNKMKAKYCLRNKETNNPLN